MSNAGTHEQPYCKCGKTMTRENSKIAPEYFLCDDCARAAPPGLIPALSTSGQEIAQILNDEDFKRKQFDCLIAVDFAGSGKIIEIPDEWRPGLDGTNCEDNQFEGVPKTPGFYKATVEFVFSQGYSEGYKSDSESEWSFKVISAQSPTVQAPESQPLTISERELVRVVYQKLFQAASKTPRMEEALVLLHAIVEPREAKEAEIKRLREALVEAVIPLETLSMSVNWELAPEIMDGIKKAIEITRSALGIDRGDKQT